MNRFIIQTPAPNFSESLNFYKKTGFQIIQQRENELIVGDGELCIKINGSPDARLGICMYTNQFDIIISKLKNSTDGVKIRDGYLFTDPNGVRLHIYPLNNLSFDMDSYPVSGLGNFAGVGIESVSYLETLKFWKIVGFESSRGNIENHKYETLSHNGGFNLTIYQLGICPHAFYNPSLTYFNGKAGNPKIINFIRSNNIQIAEEIGVFNDKGIIDNIIIRDPGGLHSFIFND